MKILYLKKTVTAAAPLFLFTLGPKGPLALKPKTDIFLVIDTPDGPHRIMLTSRLVIFKIISSKV